jgi:lysophospholipase L1-like esterase
MSTEPEFDYDNLTGRPSGPFVAVAARLVTGIGAVQQQVVPYAEQWRAANLAAIAGSGPRWIVLGDSMSQGIGASRFDAGWVNQAHERLAADGIDYRLINLSASGARVDDVLGRQLQALRGLPPRTDADPRPDLVTLLIGSNDLIRKQYRDALPAQFDRLLRELPAGTVVANLPNPRRAAVAANQLIANAARAGRIVVADMSGGRMTSWKGKLAQDHFHPNDAGYTGLADVFYRAISTKIAALSKPA